MILGFDTATPATAVALLAPGSEPVEARHDPAEGERPGHGTRLLELVAEVLERGGAAWPDVRLLAVGLGPGSFTGLRIGVATARGLSQARRIPLAGVSTLRALAEGARLPNPHAVAAVIDARRGEAFAAAWSGDAAGTERLAPAAYPPEELGRALAALGAGTLAVGDGAIRFRHELEAAGADIPEDGSPLHRVSAAQICRLGGAAPEIGRDGVVPEYLRAPDAEQRRP